MMVLPISEIYPAVQGEGLHKTPAVFVRVWGCNLRCGWNQRKDGKTQCDTPYAVFEGEKKMMPIHDVVQKIQEYSSSHLVFTGGEPTLFQEQLLAVASHFPQAFIEVETNGTIPLGPAFAQRVNQFNISPKLKSSNQWEKYDLTRINLAALKTFPAEKSILKFVIASADDLAEIQQLTAVVHFPVYLMPQGETREQIIQKLPEVLDLCLRYGYGFTNRDHIIAYGQKRGV